MKKKLQRKLLQKKLTPKPAVEKEVPVTVPEATEAPVTRRSKKKGKRVRSSICPKCGTVIARESGEKPPLCKCGAKMRKGKGTTEADVKAGKVTIEEIEAEEVHPAHPEHTSRKMALLEEATPALRLVNYKIFLTNNKSFTDLTQWWTLVFPNEDYPKDKSWFLISLRIEYKLIADSVIKDGVALSARQVVNYQAVMEMRVDKLTPTLQSLVKCCDEAHVLRLSKEEAKLIKENKE